MRPRPVLEGVTYLFTRRCSERRFFLRPDAETNNAFWYCLGWAAQKHGMVLHAAVAMSNHVHVEATDPRGVYPNFLRDFHGLLARAVNSLRGRWEHFWDANQASVVALANEEAQLDKLLYVLGNPIDIVGRASRWPGATAFHSIRDGAPVVARRPEHFFRGGDDGGAMPETVVITFEPPPAAAARTRDDYVRYVVESLAERERSASVARDRRGIRLCTARDILAQGWNQRPRDMEPRRRMSPSLACRDKWLRIERLQRDKAFQQQHRDAIDLFRRGLRAIFPLGTWMMRFKAPIILSTV